MASQPLNHPAEIPPELDRWNWGAFFLNWIWGIGNSTFIALLTLIPGVNFIMIFVLGARSVTCAALPFNGFSCRRAPFERFLGPKCVQAMGVGAKSPQKLGFSTIRTGSYPVCSG